MTSHKQMENVSSRASYDVVRAGKGLIPTPSRPHSYRRTNYK